MLTSTKRIVYARRAMEETIQLVSSLSIFEARGVDDRNLQDPKPEDTSQPYLPARAYLEMLDEPGWKAENTDIQYNVCDTRKNIHDRIVGSRYASSPVTP